VKRRYIDDFCLASVPLPHLAVRTAAPPGHSLALLSGRLEEAALFAGSPRRRETQELLDILSDGHGAEDVQEDEAAVPELLAGQVAV